ncbi:alpha/beta fold hydrolase [Streptomyces mirabilis]|uniref:alpha/beta fold hydrolase n=1 Tax=Streptomyces mirabilis TaxID=68239 RepID=UPI00367D2ED3
MRDRQYDGQYDGHYDVRGSGPLLLIIPGGAGHPMGLEGAVARLSERFTVVTYDPLGLSRGPLDGPVGDQRVEVWSDRAHRLLDSLLPDGESARVFGSSSGGIVALDLLARRRQPGSAPFWRAGVGSPVRAPRRLPPTAARTRGARRTPKGRRTRPWTSSSATSYAPSPPMPWTWTP